jgi:hypothetical protein
VQRRLVQVGLLCCRSNSRRCGRRKPNAGPQRGRPTTKAHAGNRPGRYPQPPPQAPPPPFPSRSRPHRFAQGWDQPIDSALQTMSARAGRGLTLRCALPLPCAARLACRSTARMRHRLARRAATCRRGPRRAAPVATRFPSEVVGAPACGAGPVLHRATGSRATKCGRPALAIAIADRHRRLKAARLAAATAACVWHAARLAMPLRRHPTRPQDDRWGTASTVAGTSSSPVGFRT